MTIEVAQESRVSSIVAAMDEFDLTASSAWSDIDALATRVSVDGVQVDPAGIVVKADGTFSGVFNIYLALQYGSGRDEGFSTSDSYLGTFHGHFEGEAPVIEDAHVDTSPFYA